ncbi:hypothetical protein GCM10009775_35610 [Microbacterium aoyamense]|uniref:Alpha/beta hydrolase n=1 Tax=Microbacterium aoyamense TaxID=344166 RepID=A0ABP5BF83_9MICO|nr:hypothetical protein [Microbacterium aoyamense]
MTRAQSPQEPLDAATFGVPGARRTIVVLRHGATATSDPGPADTARRDVRVLAVGLSEAELDDPAAYRGETPAETAAASVIDLIRAQAPDASVALVGVGAVAAVASRIVAESPGLVDRLVLVAAPLPETAAQRDLAEELLETVTAKTLILNAQKDPDAAAAAASWHRDHLPDVRVEMVPLTRAGDPRLSLGDVWTRVLSFCAPGTAR